MVYASDRILNRKNFTAEIEKGNLKLELDGTSDKPVVIFSGKESTRLFDLSGKYVTLSVGLFIWRIIIICRPTQMVQMRMLALRKSMTTN